MNPKPNPNPKLTGVDAQLRDLKMALTKMQHMLKATEQKAARADNAARRAFERVERLEQYIRRIEL